MTLRDLFTLCSDGRDHVIGQFTYRLVHDDFFGDIYLMNHDVHEPFFEEVDGEMRPCGWYEFARISNLNRDVS